MKQSTIIIGSIALASVAAASYQAAGKLILDGTTISTRGIVQNGQLYVPAADVAKALGKAYAYNSANRTGTISDAGGASQNLGPSGNVGEFITNGRTRIKLDPGFTDVQTPAGIEKHVTFEVRNGEKIRKSYSFGFGTTDYTLYDEQGNSKEGELVGTEFYSIWLQPAAMQRFKVKYKFGEDFKPVRMVVVLTTQLSGNPVKMETFRIKL
jgi:hypothetical protein